MRSSAQFLRILYCTITINSAGGGTAEIWTSATLRVDRVHVWISVKAKVWPLVACCCVPINGQDGSEVNIVKTLSAHKNKIVLK